jgi:hypothetical protein
MPLVKSKTEEPYPSSWRGVRGDSPLEVLEVRLRGAEKDLRGQTAYQLRERGPEAVPALCEALKDPDPSVRAAVAESLAKIGDARAIAPLTQALKRCFDTGSASRQRLLGILMAVVVCIVLGFAFVGTIKSWTAGGFVTIWLFGTKRIQELLDSRRKRGPQIVALTNAIDRIASRDPAPELRSLLPELQSVASDAIYQSPATRAATREVADRIAALTERIKSMPVAASAPEVETEQLPIAVGPP